MAVYNELQVGRYVRFLQKFFGIKGRQPAPLTFSGEITAALALFHGAENRYLESWDRFGAFTSVGASVGNNSGFRFRNPSGSNVIAVIELLRVEVDTTLTQVLLETAASGSDLGSAVVSRVLDLRTKRNNSGLSVSAGNAVASLGANTGIEFLAATIGLSGDFILFEDQELTVLPGQAVQFFTNASNVLVRGCALWRERPMEESELS